MWRDMAHACGFGDLVTYMAKMSFAHRITVFQADNAVIGVMPRARVQSAKNPMQLRYNRDDTDAAARLAFSNQDQILFAEPVVPTQEA